MPDHCHFLMHVPKEGGISNIMRAYKMGLAFQIGIGPLWQRGFHMRLPDGSSEVLRYIHLNPVRAGLSLTAEEYPWSSASGQWDVMELD
jgi:putative transposase